MKELTDLFDPEPAQWGLRGDPYVWRAMRDHLTGAYLPPSAAEAASMLYAAFERIAAIDLATEMEASVYRAEFAHGGMSSGHVSVETWRNRLMPMLLDRAQALL
jgi:hypothetical protein